MKLIDTNLAFKIIDQIDEMKIRGLTIAAEESFAAKDLDKILPYKNKEVF